MGRAATWMCCGAAAILAIACSATDDDSELNDPGPGGSGTGGAATGGVGTGATGGEGTGGAATGATGGVVGTGATGTGATASGGSGASFNQVVCPDGTPAGDYAGPPPADDGFTISNMEITGQEFQPPTTSTGRVTGRWHATNDGTSTTQQPDPNGVFVTSLICPLRSPNSARGVNTFGNGYTDFGAGMGLFLNKPDMNDPLPYDASTFTGFTFWARGTGAGMMVNVITGNGPCTPTTCAKHEAPVPVTAAWQQFSFTWTQLTPKDGAGAINPAEMYGMEWLVPGAPGGNTFDFWVDDVSFM